jgi:hypothetical protein
MDDMHEKISQRAYDHLKRHRKKYLRFVLFVIILSVFRIIEDYFLIKSLGLELEIDLFILLGTVLIAVTFTVISELTEKMVEKEEYRIEKFIKKKNPLSRARKNNRKSLNIVNNKNRV